jgi:2-hydroxy-3-keto-5-methylthiopentenyl-1-phosphate phosphatase
LRKKGQKVVYVGDGLSDKCAVREAELVFAKGDLSRFCEKEGIRHHLFSDFGDVCQILRRLLKDQRTVTGSSNKSVRGE